MKQGIQGRQTRNKSQVDAAADRRGDLKDLANRNAAPKQTTTIDFQANERKTKRLLAAHNLDKSLGGKRLFEGLSLELGPGDRLGLLGPNGSGKTTLLRLLTGQMEPDAGTVKPAAELRIVNFTQHREALNPTQKLREALCPVGDTVDYRGKPLHVASWAKKFLFDPAKFNTAVGDLSGGEQARILIANLMLQPADLLVLDEPTNDLDIPSLEVLEQALTEFPGAILLVTHDRFMLERLSTALLALDGQGNAKGFITYSQYLKWNQEQPAKDSTKSSETSTSRTHPPKSPSFQPPGPPKLTYKLQHELDQMEPTILEAEAKAEALEKQVADPQLMNDRNAYAKACEALSEVQTHIETLYERWAELEAMISS
jgi:ATP-binding cassette subfamily F protein uup